MPGPAVREESGAASEFNVIGVSANGEDFQNDSSRMISTWATTSALARISAILDQSRLRTQLHFKTATLSVNFPTGLWLLLASPERIAKPDNGQTCGGRRGNR